MFAQRLIVLLISSRVDEKVVSSHGGKRKIKRQRVVSSSYIYIFLNNWKTEQKKFKQLDINRSFIKFNLQKK